MLSELQAKALVDSIPGISKGGSLLTRVIGRLESSYGAGWGSQYGNPHNWGAITGTYNGDYFEHGDSRYDPATGTVVQYTTKFRKYPDDLAGATDLWNYLRNRVPLAVAAAERGDWPTVSRAMRDARYYIGVKPYEDSIKDHQVAVQRHLSAIVARTKEELPKAPDGPGTSGQESAALPDTCFSGPSRLPVLRLGDSGPAVLLWELLLGTPPSGRMVEATTVRTRIWQRENDLAADGIVGPKSWQAMCQLVHNLR